MTVFIKRYPSKGELPDYGQRVIAQVLEQNDLGLSKFLWNVSYHEEEKQFFLDGDIVPIGFWLKEVDLPNEEDAVKHINECVSEGNQFKAVFKDGFTACYNFIISKLKGE